jgi:hypothetical protein
MFTIQAHRFYRLLAKKAAWKTAQDSLFDIDQIGASPNSGSSGSSINNLPNSSRSNLQSGNISSGRVGANVGTGPALQSVQNDSPYNTQSSQLSPQWSQQQQQQYQHNQQQQQQGGQVNQSNGSTGNGESLFAIGDNNDSLFAVDPQVADRPAGRWAEYGITDEEMKRMAQEAYKRMHEFYQSRQPKTWYGRLGKWVADFSEYIPGIGSVVRSARMALNPEDYIYERIMERGRGIDNSFVGEELANLGLNVASAFFPGASTVGYIAKDVGLPLLENMGKDQNEMFLRQVALMSQANPNLFKDLEPFVRYAQRTTGAKL